MSVDILVTGTGMFAGRIILDLAATATEPVTVMVAGRNATRLDWLRTAGNARAAMFGTPARIVSRQIDLLEDGAFDKIVEEAGANVIVQAASIQTSAVISETGSRWTQIVAEGGLSATAVFQALMSSRMAAAISRLKPDAALINCSFPDVVNGMIAAMGHKVLCGTGNVAILSNVFSGAYDGPLQGPVRVLAHYQCLAPWRQAAGDRIGKVPPRVFIGDEEVADVFETFRQTRLTPEPAIEISGASGVTLMRALAAGTPWTGHVPAPNGLPGGYPVRLKGRELVLDLPTSVSEDEAIAWNAAFEQKNGLTVEDGRVAYHGRLRDLLAQEGFEFADGFPVSDLEAVCETMLGFRDRLKAMPEA